MPEKVNGGLPLAGLLHESAPQPHTMTQDLLRLQRWSDLGCALLVIEPPRESWRRSGVLALVEPPGFYPGNELNINVECLTRPPAADSSTLLRRTRPVLGSM